MGKNIVEKIFEAHLTYGELKAGYVCRAEGRSGIHPGRNRDNDMAAVRGHGT